MARTRDAYVHWKDVLQKWNGETNNEQIHLDDLLGLLSEDPEEWNGGKGSFLTKTMSRLGWKTKKSRRNGRIYYRADPSPRPETKAVAVVPTAPVVVQTTTVPDDDLEKLFDQIRKLAATPKPDPKLLEEVKSLREKIATLEEKNQNLVEDLDKKIRTTSLLESQIADLEKQIKAKPVTKIVEKIVEKKTPSSAPELARRTHELQKEVREQANTIRWLETKNSNLQRQVEILESSTAANPTQMLNSGANPKSVRQLLAWFGLNFDRTRVIASGRNLNHEVEVEIDDDKIIRYVVLPGEPGRRSYHEISLDDGAAALLSVLFPCRVFYQTLTSNSIAYACELLGKPLRLV